MTEKSESKSSSTQAEGKENEVHPLDLAREEGMRRNPTAQTSHLDTSTDGVVDLRQVASIFEEARQDAVRHAADVLDPDTDTVDPNVIEPDDADDAERARDELRREAANLPPASENTRSGYGDGMGDLQGQEGVTAQRAEGAKAEDDKSATKPAPAKNTTATKSTTPRAASK
jgi:hypothetical protein